MIVLLLYLSDPTVFMIALSIRQSIVDSQLYVTRINTSWANARVKLHSQVQVIGYKQALLLLG